MTGKLVGVPEAYLLLSLQGFRRYVRDETILPKDYKPRSNREFTQMQVGAPADGGKYLYLDRLSYEDVTTLKNYIESDGYSFGGFVPETRAMIASRHRINIWQLIKALELMKKEYATKTG